MSAIANFPYFEVQFTKDGAVYDSTETQKVVSGVQQDGITDLLVFSHGWNNDMADARHLYQEFFTNFGKLLAARDSTKTLDRKFAVLGILWPSKKFAERDLIPSGAASLAGAVSDDELAEQIDNLAAALQDPAATQKLEEAKAFLTQIDFDPSARDAFVEKVRASLPTPSANEEIANDFFNLSGEEVMAKLEVPLDLPTANGMGGAASFEGDASGGAAGLGDLLSGAKAAASRVLNIATYYTMKERAGAVGQKGVAPLISAILAATPTLRIHLIGHSFGGRVVAATAFGMAKNDAAHLRSMSLLQAAFSHNGFAQNFDGSRDGYFRKVITEKKIAGPIIITYTQNDNAVGKAYPIASKLSREDASALGDAKDRFGGMGRNGAQFTPEAEFGMLAAADGKYSFGAGKIFNLEATKYIQNHGDVMRGEVAGAVLAAVLSS